MDSIKIKSILILLLIFSLIQEVFADEFNIKLSSPPTVDLVALDIELIFEQPTVIYHWLSGKSIYPILNRGLYVKCHNLESGEKVVFMPNQQFLPKLPHKIDILNTSKYTEELIIIPGRNYVTSNLREGKYSLKLIYNPNNLKSYPGGTELSNVTIESNEITFEIK